jgi:hypothetical protein
VLTIRKPYCDTELGRVLHNRLRLNQTAGVLVVGFHVRTRRVHPRKRNGTIKRRKSDHASDLGVALNASLRSLPFAQSADVNCRAGSRSIAETFTPLSLH